MATVFISHFLTKALVHLFLNQHEKNLVELFPVLMESFFFLGEGAEAGQRTIRSFINKC